LGGSEKNNAIKPKTRGFSISAKTSVGTNSYKGHKTNPATMRVRKPVGSVYNSHQKLSKGLYYYEIII